jgi:hypothetical protein
MGLYLWKTEVSVSSGVEVYFVWICNDERNEEYSVHLVGPELNIYITKMYGTTSTKFIKAITQHCK